MPLLNCDECYELTQVIDCEAPSIELSVASGLTPSTAYYVHLKDTHGKVYIFPTTTTAGGDLSVTLPTDMRSFRSFSGKFEMSISTSDSTNTGETLTIGSQTYTCLVVSFDEAEWSS